MRIGKRAASITSQRLYSAARLSAEAITATGNIGIGLPRYLVLLGDALQSQPPSPPVRPSSGSASLPAAPLRPIRSR
jgi:hypothetical protein